MYKNLVIIIGFLLRFREYLFNRSMWVDEAIIALNRDQHAPIGFLWLEKLSSLFLGNGEYSLRLIPFLLSILSIPLFYKVSRYFLKKQEALLSLFIFSILNVLIYYSSEAKQYSLDVFVTLVIYFSFFKLIPNLSSLTSILILTFLGGVIIWFSHPAVFVLGGLGITLLISLIHKRENNNVRSLLFCYSFWLISFVLLYIISLRQTASEQYLRDFWETAFAPNPLTHFSNLGWYLDIYSKLSHHTLRLSFENWTILILIIGIIALFRNSKRHFSLLLSPLVLVILASMLEMYPLIDRFLLFFVPNILIIITYGVLGVGQVFQNLVRLPRLITQVVLTVLLFLPSIFLDIDHLFKSRVTEDIKPVLEFLSVNKQAGDTLYIYYGAEPAFRYYSRRYGLEKIEYTIGINSRTEPSAYIEDLDKLRGRSRVWILFSHVINTRRGLINEERVLVNRLDDIGQRLDYFQAQGASAYLYNLEL